MTRRDVALDRHPFLSIIGWPEQCQRDELARLLHQVAGVDEATARIRLGLTPPLIVGQVPPEKAAPALRALATRGGEGFAPTLGDLEALGPTVMVKNLGLVEGVLQIELRDGGRASVRREDVRVLVRAQLKSTTTTHWPVKIPGVSARYRTFDSIKAEVESSVVRTISTSNKLDIHTAAGRVYQVDGDRFGFGILGQLRGHSDKANMDSLCQLLAHVTPNEVVDDFYPLWRPPPTYRRLRLPDMKRQGEDPAFAFYSRWVALMYRHLRG